ncbi:hypothetical protein XENTR_v10005080 [Xenopus tropicalis]|nr:hypothetical protein XENTR_v10005080 [Xenopus tropicalis]
MLQTNAYSVCVLKLPPFYDFMMVSPHLCKMPDDFERFEREARELSGLEDYDTSTARRRKIKLPFDVGPQEHIQLNPRDKFIVNTFLPILDKLLHELRRRAEAYKSLISAYLKI